jgi:hypothetical protein
MHSFPSEESSETRFSSGIVLHLRTIAHARVGGRLILTRWHGAAAPGTVACRVLLDLGAWLPVSLKVSSWAEGYGFSLPAWNLIFWQGSASLPPYESHCMDRTELQGTASQVCPLARADAIEI